MPGQALTLAVGVHACVRMCVCVCVCVCVSGLVWVCSGQLCGLGLIGSGKAGQGWALDHTLDPTVGGFPGMSADFPLVRGIPRGASVVAVHAREAFLILSFQRRWLIWAYNNTCFWTFRFSILHNLTETYSLAMVLVHHQHVIKVVSQLNS